MSSSEIRDQYPSGRVKNDSKRMFVMNTMFNMAEISLVSQIIQRLEDQGKTQVNYDGVFSDIRDAIDDMHVESLDMKTTILKHPEQFIKRDPRLGLLLEKMRSDDKKVFLLTNSDWWYTSRVMTFILGSDWSSMFDAVFVDACKPRFFRDSREMIALESCGGTPCYSGGDEVRIIRV